MWLYLIILSIIIVFTYGFPTVRYFAKRISFIIKVKQALKESDLKIYGRIPLFSAKRKTFFIEKENELYSVIVFPCFFKTMLFFNLNGSMQVRCIGVRRYVPFRSYYEVSLDDFNFEAGYNELPEECHSKAFVPILLFNPVPVDIRIPLNRKLVSVTVKNIQPQNPMNGWIHFRHGERSTSDGEFIEKFFICGGECFIKQIKGESDIFKYN